MNKVKVVLERDEDGRFSAHVPDLQGCGAVGETKQEALANVRQEVERYVAMLQRQRVGGARHRPLRD